jgi:integrase/recombinase XerD
VLGKGRKVREVPIKSGTLDALRAWLACRGTASGPLVCWVRRGGRLELRRLAPQAILRVCEKRGREAGISGFVAHDLRRTYISALLDLGAHFADRERLFRPIVNAHSGDRERSGATLVRG